MRRPWPTGGGCAKRKKGKKKTDMKVAQKVMPHIFSHSTIKIAM
jgi:hypothetical protein